MIESQVTSMSHPIDTHVGQKLKQRRVMRRLSQTDVALKLEISFQQVQKYETGSNRISASRLFEIANVLDVKPAYFFEGIHDDGHGTTPNVQGLDLTTALCEIKDEATKTKILNYIEEVSGVRLPAGHE